MSKKVLREWKKVFLTDLSYIVYELKELTKSPCMVILEGEVGAGKTTFIQQFIGAENVLSPTYSIVNEYKGIVHVDLYRLEKADDLLTLELMPLLEDKQFFLVEWGEKFQKRLFRELPENFTTFLLQISVNKSPNESASNTSRNFILYSITED